LESGYRQRYQNNSKTNENFFFKTAGNNGFRKQALALTKSWNTCPHSQVEDRYWRSFLLHCEI